MAAQRSPHGASTLLGHGLKSDSLLATFTNAAAGVALEMDEGNRLGGGHPAIHVIPGALAVAEEMGADGARFLESVIAGYEVGSRLGGATVARPNVHSHGTWGTISTAAAVARLHDLPADEIRHVINLSASMSPANTWTPALEGATIRNAYPGRSGLEGILAVDLHRAGFTALDDAPSDVYGTILADSFDPEAAVAGLGESFRIEQNYFKFHACCRMNHPALDAVMASAPSTASPATTWRPSTITSVPVRAPHGGDRAAQHARRQVLDPLRGGRGARPGRARTPRPSRSACWTTRASARWRSASTLAKDDEMALKRADYPTAHVRVALRDGRVLTQSDRRGARRRGQSRRTEDVVAKFLSLASGPLGARRAREIIEAVDGVDGLKDVRDLTALLVPPKPDRRLRPRGIIAGMTALWTLFRRGGAGRDGRQDPADRLLAGHALPAPVDGHAGHPAGDAAQPRAGGHRRRLAGAADPDGDARRHPRAHVHRLRLLDARARHGRGARAAPGLGTARLDLRDLLPRRDGRQDAARDGGAGRALRLDGARDRGHHARHAGGRRPRGLRGRRSWTASCRSAGCGSSPRVSSSSSASARSLGAAGLF